MRLEEMLAVLTRMGEVAPLPLATGEHGKPYFDAPNAPKFNFTHTAGLTALALGDCEAGIDAQLRDPRPRPALLRRLSPEERAENFFRLWTAKEAYIKYRGGTIASMLSRLRYAGGTLYENGVPVHAVLRFWEVENCTLCLCTQSPVEAELVAL